MKMIRVKHDWDFHSGFYAVGDGLGEYPWACLVKNLDGVGTALVPEDEWNAYEEASRQYSRAYQAIVKNMNVPLTEDELSKVEEADDDL